MDLQTILNNAMDASRANEMLDSEQLTIGELLLKLEVVKDKEKPIVLDDGIHKPTGLGSWRGSYKEMSINYDEGGGQSFYTLNSDCKKDEYGYHSYDCPCKFSASLPSSPTAGEFLEMLSKVKGNYFEGYKGGDYLMGKSTPVWVANYGDSSGYKNNDKGDYQAVVDVIEDTECVRIITSLMKY